MNDIERLEQLINEFSELTDLPKNFWDYTHNLKYTIPRLQLEINKEILRILKKQNESM